MALAAHTTKSPKGARQTSKRVGRGNASGKGTYAGRGMKGQRSRSGGAGGLKLRGLKQSLQKVPKVRGFKSPVPAKQTVTLSTLSRATTSGEAVDPHTLEAKGIIKNAKHGVKIVATGELAHPLTIKGCVATKKALELIEQKGGKLTF